MGNLPAVPINASTHDWGPPYSTDIYGTDAYSFIAARDTAYVDTPFAPGTVGVAHTVLYVSRRTLDEVQYEKFLHFMMEEFARLSDSLTGADLREFPHLIGLVYGAREKYVHDFRGRHEGKAMILRIEPDGRARFVEDNKWANETYSGLAEKVHMPGKILRLRSPAPAGALSVDDMRGFRDAQDVPVEARFGVVQVPDTSTR